MLESKETVLPPRSWLWKIKPNLDSGRNLLSLHEGRACVVVEDTLDSCPQLAKKPHKEKIGFLREKGVCFGCLCIGHISKDCRKRISCERCGLNHPTVLHMLHIPPKGESSVQAERKSEALAGGTLVSSGLTGAGDHDCMLPIVPVQVKSKKGSKIRLRCAVRTMLGWTVNGPLKGDGSNAVDWERPELTVNRMSVVNFNLDELWQHQFVIDFVTWGLWKI